MVFWGRFRGPVKMWEATNGEVSKSLVTPDYGITTVPLIFHWTSKNL